MSNTLKPKRYNNDGGRLEPSDDGELFIVCEAHAFYSAEIAELQAELYEQRGAHERAAHVVRDLQAENERLKAFEEGGARLQAAWEDASNERDKLRIELASIKSCTESMREALASLLPGLILDLRYAHEGDDMAAMQSRIDTVINALKVHDVSVPKGDGHSTGDTNVPS